MTPAQQYPGAADPKLASAYVAAETAYEAHKDNPNSPEARAASDKMFELRLEMSAKPPGSGNLAPTAQHAEASNLTNVAISNAVKSPNSAEPSAPSSVSPSVPAAPPFPTVAKQL